MEQADWDALKAQMSSPWGTMKLQCDQYQLILVQELSSNSWSTVVYVDGLFKGAWMTADENGQPKYDEAKRFLRKTTRSLFTRNAIEKTRKVFGKRESEKMAARKLVLFSPSWKSFNSLRKHLLENNASIQRLH